MTKTYKEVITCKGWKDGSGWQYESTYAENIVAIDNIDDIEKDADWSWIDYEERADGEDVNWTCSYYELDDEDCKSPLASVSVWETELTAVSV